MIAGIEIDLGGTQYTVPPLTLGALEGLQKRLEAFNGVGAALTPEHMRTVVDAAHLALKRNYPQLTREEVGELIDLGNMHEVLAAVTDVSGLRRKQAGEPKPQTASPAAG